MTDKEKIKKEIERRIKSMNSCPFKTAELGSEKFNDGELYAYKQILQFINSLPEEHVSDDLEDAAYHFCMDEYGNPKESLFVFDQRCFVAGAEWQRKKDQETIELAEDHAMLAGMNKMKEEIMKDAVEGEIGDIMPFIEVGEMNNYLNYVKAHGLKIGDKVKIIILKTE